MTLSLIVALVSVLAFLLPILVELFDDKSAHLILIDGRIEDIKNGTEQNLYLELRNVGESDTINPTFSACITYDYKPDQEGTYKYHFDKSRFNAIDGKLIMGDSLELIPSGGTVEVSYNVLTAGSVGFEEGLADASSRFVCDISYKKEHNSNDSKVLYVAPSILGVTEIREDQMVPINISRK